MKELKELDKKIGDLEIRYSNGAMDLLFLEGEYLEKESEALSEENKQIRHLLDRKNKALQKTLTQLEEKIQEIEKEREPLTSKIEHHKWLYNLEEYEEDWEPYPQKLDEKWISELNSRHYKSKYDTFSKLKRTLKVGYYEDPRELEIIILHEYLNANALLDWKIQQAMAAQAEEEQKIRTDYDAKIMEQQSKWKEYHAAVKRNFEKKKKKEIAFLTELLASGEMKDVVRKAEQIQKKSQQITNWDVYALPKTMPDRMHLADIHMEIPVDMLAENKNFEPENQSGLKKKSVTMPAYLNLFQSNIVVITADKSLLRPDGPDKLTAQRIIAHMMKILPPQNCDYSLFDIGHKGQALGRFIDLADMGSDLHFSVYTEKEQASKHRKELLEKPAEIIREMAGHSKTLFEYNRKEFRIPFTWYMDLSFSDAPTNDMKTELKELMKTAGITGTSFLFVTSDKGCQVIERMAKDFPEINLYHLDCAKLKCSDEEYILPLIPGKTPDSKQISTFVQSVKTFFTKNCSDDNRLGASMKQIQKPKFEPFSEVLSLPFAKDSRGNLLEMKLGGKDGVHGFISGDTGCGKSTLLHSIILSACRKYSPGDLKIWLADYKMTDFALYKTNTPPHITFIGVSTAEEFTYGFLDKIEAEAMHRVNLFQKFNVKDLGNYRTHAGEPGYVNLPILLIVIDEFQIMSQTVLNDSYYKDKLENSLRLYRAHGIRFLLASQTFSKGLNGLSEAAKDQIGIRLAMRNKTLQDVKDSLETSAPYTEAMEKSIKLMDPGDIIMARNLRDDKERLLEVRLEKYRSLYVSEKDIHSQLAVIRSSYEKYIKIPDPLYINTNVQFPWNPADMDALDRMEPRRNTEMRLYLGRCDQLRPCFGLDFSRKTNENLSIIGGKIHQRWELITSILNSVWRNNYQTFVFLAPESDLDHDHGDALRALCDRIPRITLLDTYEKWCCTLSDLAEQVSDKDNRVEIFCLFLSPEDAWEEFEELPDYETVYENVSNMMKYASPDMPIVVSEKYNAIPLIQGLFELGPRRGLHCIIEAGTYSDLSRMRDIVDKCRHRIAFHISEDECMSYLGSGRYYNSIGIYAAYSCGGNNAPRLVPYKYVP